MPEAHCVISKCDCCQQENNIPLGYYVDFDTKFEKSVVAKCQTCSKGFIVTFDESMIRQRSPQITTAKKLSALLECWVINKRPSSLASTYDSLQFAMSNLCRSLGLRGNIDR